MTKMSSHVPPGLLHLDKRLRVAVSSHSATQEKTLDICAHFIDDYRLASTWKEQEMMMMMMKMGWRWMPSNALIFDGRRELNSLKIWRSPGCGVEDMG